MLFVYMKPTPALSTKGTQMTQGIEGNKSPAEILKAEADKWNKRFPLGTSVYKLAGTDKKGRQHKIKDEVASEAIIKDQALYVFLKNTGNASYNDLEAITEKNKNEILIRSLSSKLFIFALIVFASVCAYFTFHKNNNDLVISAITLFISLFCRSFLSESKKTIVRVLKLLGDWAAVTFTLSTMLKLLSTSPWLIVILTISLAFCATIAFMKET